jgi:hypothetical protein
MWVPKPSNARVLSLFPKTKALTQGKRSHSALLDSPREKAGTVHRPYKDYSKKMERSTDFPTFDNGCFRFGH